MLKEKLDIVADRWIGKITESRFSNFKTNLILLQIKINFLTYFRDIMPAMLDNKTRHIEDNYLVLK